MMRGNFGNFGGFGWIGLVLNLVIMAAIIVGIIVLAIYAIRGLRRRSNQSGLQGPAVTSQVMTPRDIIQARYARGDITREQYLAMLEDLK